MTSSTYLLGTRIALVAICLVLTAIGVLFVHSTTAGSQPFPGSLARGQILKALAAVGLFSVVCCLDYRLFERFASAFYAVLFVVLVALLVTRSPLAKTARWIDLHFMKVQPSELMKVGVILVLARYLRFRTDQRRVAGLVIPYLLVFAPMALVAVQPDLGTSLMLPPILVALLYIARARLWPLAVTVLAGLGSLPVAYFLSQHLSFMQPYQIRRITAYFQGEGYQLQQSLISLGSGGLLGKGWGHGTQNTLGWLPEKHTDFIFSVIGEEWGFAGAATVTLLYIALIALCLNVAIRTREPFGRLVATGVAVAFAAQVFQNLAMTMGITPITGLPLPFVSFGGSSLVSSFFAVGLTVAIASRQVRVVASRDLNPLDEPRVMELTDVRPAGTILRRWPV